MPTKSLSIQYPWHRTEKGQGFFVPCLDTHVTREAGLKAALKHRCFDARAYPAIRGGLIGVWFYRKP